jgi:hypothetical protein
MPSRESAKLLHASAKKFLRRLQSGNYYFADILTIHSIPREPPPIQKPRKPQSPPRSMVSPYLGLPHGPETSEELGLLDLSIRGPGIVPSCLLYSRLAVMGSPSFSVLRLILAVCAVPGHHVRHSEVLWLERQVSEPSY